MKGGLGELSAVDVGYEAKHHGAIAEMIKRLIRHDRAKTGAPVA